VQVRQVADGDRRITQQGGGENRQGGVLRPGNAEFAVEANTAGNNQFVNDSLGLGARSPIGTAEKFHAHGVDAAIGNPGVEVSVDLLLTLDRAKAGQLVADQVQLEVAAFAFNFHLGIRQFSLQEAFHF
jgi:hypothetical protein